MGSQFNPFAILEKLNGNADAMIDHVLTMASLTNNLHPTCPEEVAPMNSLMAGITALQARLLDISPVAKSKYLAQKAASQPQYTLDTMVQEATGGTTASADIVSITGDLPMDAFGGAAPASSTYGSFVTAPDETTSFGSYVTAPRPPPGSTFGSYVTASDTAPLSASFGSYVTAPVAASITPVMSPEERLTAAEQPDAVMVGEPSTAFWALFGTALALGVVALAGTIWLIATRVNPYTISMLVLTGAALVFVATVLGLRGKVKLALSAVALALLAGTLGVSIYYTVRITEAGPIFTTVAVGLATIMVVTSILAGLAYDI